VRFRELVPPRPQCERLGISYEGVRGPTDPPRSYSVNPAALKDAWFRGTGFTATSMLRHSVGTNGTRFSRVARFHLKPSCSTMRAPDLTESPQPLTLCATSLPRGARIFSSGSLQFVWGLDNYYGARDAPPNPRLQRFMRNALADLTSKALKIC
jgi:hypothetical protein